MDQAPPAGAGGLRDGDGGTGDEQRRFNIDDLFLPVGTRRLRRLPRLVGMSMRLCFRAARREFLASVALQLASGAALAALVLVVKWLVNTVLSLGTEGDFRRVLPSLAMFAVLSAIVSFANTARLEQERVLTELVSRYAIDQVLEVATTVELLAYESPAFHNRLQRALINAEIRPVQMASGILGMVSASIAIAGIGAALLVLEPVFLLPVLVAFVPAWLVSVRASRVSHDFSLKQTERDRLRLYLRQVLAGKDEAKEVRAFNLDGFLRERHDGLHQARIDDLRQMVRRRLRLGLMGGLATSFLTSAALGVLTWFVTSGRMPVASAAAAAGAVVVLGQRLRVLAGSSGSLFESSLFLEDFTTFVDSMPRIAGARSTLAPPPGFSRLSVHSVTFCYPSRREPSLRNVSMEIGAGEVVALVGLNGSGKTTLAKLLAGLYQPTGGVVAWDGVDVATFDQDQLRARVAVIFQDFIRYFLTAGENIGMGRHERFDDQGGIVAASRYAGAHEFLEALSDGYRTRLGPHYLGGSDLSVGQWQRVALARAFFRDAPFIVLDEPTAALDPRAEYELFERIRDLAHGRAVLLISHRFSSVRSADRIYVLSQGQVAEGGTHRELMEQGGLYAELFQLQAAAYGQSDV